MYPNINAELARRGMTQGDLAVFLGVGRKTVNKWLTGKSSIPVEVLCQLKKSWGTSIDYLLDRCSPNQKEKL
ncbi:helix-turn-helix domain-containing protein [Ileibacterium valens]|uniref:HTH cro/C1-type domain-containing protein n=2 Tax=Ileibacterium valens TaxID=1862668 RepID=A0A1U7NHT1_9FIRM|nr:hypothetical protein BO224_05420 [Erysipelotrichaceae bacterium NYU-BL-E8]OLU41651.1 hypothetical protein BO222_02815 [Ileibacterium valens]OLU42855.1 hypothetical protein BM735_01300 [Erysipelotrichaceae bacterium NYU-BL-F16]